MTWGRHPIFDFEAALHIGQEVEARFASRKRALRFRARIVELNKPTARVEVVEDGWGSGHVLVTQRFPSPLWSQIKAFFPLTA